MTTLGDDDVPIPCEVGTTTKGAYRIGCVLPGWRGLRKAAKGHHIRIRRNKAPEARMKIRPNDKYFDEHTVQVDVKVK